MGVVVEKKSKVRDSHMTAIAQYRKWLKDNPTATHTQKFKAFDSLVDLAAISRTKKVNGS